MMKPILFNTEMVQAIMEGRKTVTRRLVKPAPAGDGTKPEELTITRPGYWNSFGDDNVYRQPCKPGDILYVRETWDNEPITPGGHFRPRGVWYYKADGDLRPEAWRGNWHPSIHMPKEAARLFLRVKNVRVERLQDIDEEGAKAEGANFCNGKHVGFKEKMRRSAVERFADIWNSTIKPADLPIYGWDANPWVWVIEYERCEKPEGM